MNESVVASAITRESGRLVAIARQAGRTKHSVELYWNALSLERRAPLVIDSIQLSSAAERSRFVEMLPAGFSDYAEEATTLLRNLAAEVAAAPPMKPQVQPREMTAASPEITLEPYDDEVDGARLLSNLSCFLGRYIVLPPFAADAIALWILHTYLIDSADYTPYILVSSPVRECGKSTLLELLAHLTSRARKTDGITAAALYRIIDKHQPTMLLDELDTRLLGEGGEALRRVLNSGFARDGKVTICTGDDYEPRDFRTFCPKVLAGIGRTWDTVTSRSIPVRLARATKSELSRLIKLRGDRIASICLPLRRQLLRWALDERDRLRDNDPMVPAALGARQADVWRPLLAIADRAGGSWPVLARRAAVALHRAAEEESDYGLLLLEDLRTLYVTAAATSMSTARIIEELNKMEHRPWPEYRNDRPITPRGLANLLGRFGIKPKTIRIGDMTPKGYELEQLTPAFLMYLTAESPQSDPSATSATENGVDMVADVADRNESRADDRSARGVPELWEPGLRDSEASVG